MDKEMAIAKENEKKLKEIGAKFNFDVWYAEAWSRRQGYLSFKLANNLKKKFEAENKVVNSVLDVCSGSGEFLNVMSNFVKTCVGVDNAEGYLQLVRSKFKDIEFIKIKDLYKFDLKRKFDLVTCNHDVINMFLKFVDWETFFDVVYKHLENEGMFIFDFYTDKKMKEWDFVSFEQDYTLDYVQSVKRQYDACVMDEVYYIRESETLYRKTADTMIETSFPTEQIVKALEKAGFVDLQYVDVNLEPIEDLENAGRIHILCKKK